MAKNSIGKSNSVGLLSCFVLFFGSVAVSVAGESQSEYRDGARIGAGFELLNDELRGDCIEFKVADQDNPDGQHKEYTFKEVTDSSELLDTFKLSASAKYSAGFGTASGKAALARESKINEYFHSTAVYMSVRNSAKTIVGPKLTAAMVELAKKSPADFRQKCGNSFISSIVTGGELAGLITSVTNNREEEKQASIDLHYDGKALEADGSLSDTYKSALKRWSSEGHVTESGGNTTVAMTGEELINKFRAFPEEVKTKNITYSVTLKDYKTVENYPLELDLTNDAKAIERLMTKVFNLRTVQDDIVFILNHPEQFIRPDAQSLDKLNGLIDGQLRTLEAAVDKCKQDKICDEPPVLGDFELRSQLPLRYISECGNYAFSSFEKAADPQNADSYNFYGESAAESDSDDLRGIELQGLQVFAGELTNGNNDMANAESILTELQVALDIPPNTNNLIMSLSGSLVVQEDGADRTTLQGRFDNIPVANLLASSHPHCGFDINQSGLEPFGRISHPSSRWNGRAQPFNDGTGLLRSARCRVNGRGQDVGAVFCDSIRLRDYQVKLKHEEDFFDVQRLNQTTRENLLSKGISP